MRRYWAEFLLSCLLFGYSFADYGFLGFFVTYAQTNLKVHLRDAIAVANTQGVFSAFFSIWMIYFGRFRAGGLSRMILYSYSTYIAGTLLLWLNEFMSSQYLVLALVLITIGQSGERCVALFFGVGWEEGSSFLGPPTVAVMFLPPRKPRCTRPIGQVSKGPDFWKKIRYIIARVPGATVGAFYVSSLSTPAQTYKVTALAMVLGYHLFFWFGPKVFFKPVNTIDGEKNEDGATSLLYELKRAIRVLTRARLFPLWLTFTFSCSLVSATGNTFFFAQVFYLKQGNRSYESYFNYAAQFVSVATGLGCEWLMEKWNKREHDENEHWGARLFRVGVGMAFSILCCLVACLVADRRSDSLFWLVPQWLLLAVMRGIGIDGLAGFISDCLRKSDGESFHISAVLAVAEILGNIICAMLALASPSSWIGTDVGRSDLYHYYRMLAVISLGSSVLFFILVSAFRLLGQYPQREDEVGGRQRRG